MADNPKVVSMAPQDTAAVAAGERPSVPDNREFRASLYGSKDPLPKEFVVLIRKLEQELEMPIWMLIQNGDGDWSAITSAVYKGMALT